MVRPDLERLLLYHQSLPDPAARLDDILLTACSDWVNEYSGLRQHRRGPAGHVPRAGHEARAGAVAPDGRAVVAVARSHRRRDLEPGDDAAVAGGAARRAAARGALRGRVAERAGDRRHRGSRPAADQPRAGDLLAGTGAGRHRHRAGRHRQQPPPVVRVGVGGDGSRAGAGHAQHRDERRGAGAADDEPADPSRQGSSATWGRRGSCRSRWCPRRTRWSRGVSSSAWDGGFQLDEPIGEGVHARIEATGRAFLEQPWGLAKPRGAAGTRLSLSFRFPMSVVAAAGADGAPDAVGGRVVRIRRRAHGRELVVRAAPGAERQGGSDQVRAGRRAAAPAAADRRHQPAAGRRGHLVALRRVALRRHRRAGARCGRAAGDGAVARHAVAGGPPKSSRRSTRSWARSRCTSGASRSPPPRSRSSATRRSACG